MKRVTQDESPKQLELSFPARETPVSTPEVAISPEAARLAPFAPSASVAPVAPKPAVAKPAADQASANIRRGLRVIQGGGQRTQEKLGSRDAVVRVLVEAGADMLLRRISAERAEHIEQRVNHILDLFDQVDAKPALLPLLQKQLDELEVLMSETRANRARRPG